MSKREGKFVKCYVCHEKIWVSPSDLKSHKRGTNRFFCSKKHSNYWRYETEEGKTYFKNVYRRAAARGSTKAANESVRGKPPWNKGLTKETDVRVAKSANKRMNTYCGKEGLAYMARRWMASSKRGMYATEESLPRRQRKVLEMVRMITGKERVAFEHFMLLDGNRPIFIDVAVPGDKLAIEVDGSSHSTLRSIREDARRDDSLHKMGWNVLRIKNDCVDQFPKAVQEAIRKALIGRTGACKKNNKN